MKTGRTLPELAQEIERVNTVKKDFLADTREIAMLNGNELTITGQGEFGITKLGHQQLSEALGIPRSYYERMRADFPALLDRNVNTLAHDEPKVRMVRTLDGNVRAFLSDRYRRLDNFDLLTVAFPILQEIEGVEFPSVEITDSRLYIKAVAPKVQGVVETRVRPGTHHIYGEEGDVVQAGVVITNSEVGLGALDVKQFVRRLVCSNGLIAESLMTKRHIGGRLGYDSDLPVELFREDTLKADDQAVFLMLRDLVRAAVDETRFQQTLARMNLAAKSEPIQDVSAGVKELGRRFDLGEEEQKSVLHFLAEGGDLSQWGALNAITRASADLPSYDRATELEAVGGKVLALPSGEWAQIARAGLN